MSSVPSWPIDTAYFVVPPPGLDLRYLYYLLMHLRLGSLNRSTAVPGLSRDDAYARLASIPPTNEQFRIVEKLEALLSDLDAAVQTLERALEKLKRYRQAVLKAVVEGELSREWRESHKGQIESASELLKRILVERRRKWEETELAKMREKGIEPQDDKWKAKYEEPTCAVVPGFPVLPPTWTWATIGQLISEPLCNGLSIRGTKTPTDTRALRLNAMTDEGLNFHEYRFLPIALREVDDLVVRKGDIYVSRGNGSLSLVGRGSLAQEPPFPVIFPDTMIRVRLCESQSTTRWVSAIWGSRFVRGQIEKRVKTTAGIWKISQPQLASVTVPLPPMDEQFHTVADLERRQSVLVALERVAASNLRRAARLRQSILDKAFRGELVPQDTSDEPASVLLERIRVQRAAKSTIGAAIHAAQHPRRGRKSRVGTVNAE